MASQRITIAKLVGVSGDIALRRLATWSAARDTADPELWGSQQWPEQVRIEADDFADALRAHGLVLPVCHFVEWSDLWSMGDVLTRWLTPPNSPDPIEVCANRFQVFAYSLPDGGRLADYLSGAGPQQFPEYDWYIVRLREAVQAWDSLVPNATLVVLRHVISGLVLDEEVTASLQTPAPWLS